MWHRYITEYAITPIIFQLFHEHAIDEHNNNKYWTNDFQFSSLIADMYDTGRISNQRAFWNFFFFFSSFQCQLKIFFRAYTNIPF